MKRVSDRQVGGALLMRYARSDLCGFCLSFVYEDDAEFIADVAKDAGIEDGRSCTRLLGQLRRVCRRLEAAGVLGGRVSSCHAEYLGEPRVLKRWQWAEPGYACRLAPEKYTHYKPMGKTETELELFLDRAWPRPL